MKLHFIKYMFFTAVLMIAISSCDEYLDVNTDPNRVTVVTLEALLPTTIEATNNAHYTAARTACQVSQQIGSYFGYPEMLSMSGTWSKIYLKSMNNLSLLVQQAEKEASPHYAGVGKVLQAVNLGLLADNWEAAPYLDAFKGSDNFTPTYDSQESLYNSINSLLNDAISDLQAEESVFSPGSDDLAYGGNIAQWTKVAYTLKARYAMHLSNKGGNVANDVLTGIEKGMTDNGDDFQLNYNAVNKNPWHTKVALSNQTGNLSVAPGSYLMDIMSATAGGDPRLSAYADTTGTGAASYIGINSFDEDAPGNTTDITTAVWFATESAPVLMVTYAEAKFLEAEAAMMSGDAERAYTAYLDGIAASMAKVGADGTDYMAHADVAVGMDNLKLSDIMREKYIALYLNPESWVDMRRHHYDTAVYPGFEIPMLNDLVLAHQRVRYPTSENDRNGDNVQANIKPDALIMWRDQ